MTERTKDPIDAVIGSRVRARRMAIGMSQELLGKNLGLTFQQVQKYEKGVNRIGCGRLIRIAQILRVKPGSFFEGIDDPEHAEASAIPISADAIKAAFAFDKIPQPHLRGAVANLIERLGAEQ